MDILKNIGINISLLKLFHISMILSGMISFFLFPITKTIMIFATFILIGISHIYLRFNKKEFFFAVLFGYLSWFGSIYFYTNYYYYDKVLHFLIAFLIYAIIYSRLKEYFKHSNIKGVFIIVCVTSSLGLLSFWEIYEYTITNYLQIQMIGVWDGYGNKLLGEIDDTIIDLVVGVFGIIFSAMYKYSRDNL